MTGISVLLLGVGLGLRHATDADHVIVVSTLVQREPGIWRATRLAALWGAGHSAAFLGVGLLIVLAGVRVPAPFERAMEMLVATMLVGIGVWHLWKRSHAEQPVPTVLSSSARPILIGLVHGLAGSAGIALLAATTISPPALAVAYLGLLGLGTVVGMIGLTMAIARPIGWTMPRRGPLRTGVTAASALTSIALGAVVLLRSVSEW